MKWTDVLVSFADAGIEVYEDGLIRNDGQVIGYFDSEGICYDLNRHTRKDIGGISYDIVRIGDEHIRHIPRLLDNEGRTLSVLNTLSSMEVVRMLATFGTRKGVARYVSEAMTGEKAIVGIGTDTEPIPERA